MPFNETARDAEDGCTGTSPKCNESSPLLSSQQTTSYVEFPKPAPTQTWTPSAGFWWIETGETTDPLLYIHKLTPIALWANVFLSGFDGTITASTYAAIGSEFNAANNAAWLTTSYLVTSTAFQPLYGRLSDMFGRRICFFVSTIAFMVGCFGCSVSQTILQLDFMRGLTGFGGGGLITMGTGPPLQERPET